MTDYTELVTRLRETTSRSKGKLLTEAANAIEDLRLSRNNYRDVASRSAADLNAAGKEIKTLRKAVKYYSGCDSCKHYIAWACRSDCKGKGIDYSSDGAPGRFCDEWEFDHERE